MHRNFEITRVDMRGRVVLLRVKGRVEQHAAHLLIEQGREVLAQGRSLIVDLAGVQFMGSSGVAAMLALSGYFEERGRVVRFSNPSPCVSALIDLLQLREVVSVDTSQSLAMQAVHALP
jgi:anti-anti-sigma factor